MTNFNPASLDWTAGVLAGWTYDKAVNKWFQGAFRQVHRITRLCPTCSDTIVLDVTAKALEGKATNHGLSLRRCKKCRAALKSGPAVYAERKSMDKPEPGPPMQNVVSGELEMLRAANATMKEELEGLYVLNKELRQQLEQHELDMFNNGVTPTDIVQILNGTTETKPLDATSADLLQKWLDKNKPKMPWNGA